MLDDDSAFNILNDNLGIYKGAIYENIVADGLSKNDVPLYYYSKNNSLEIDFIYKHQNEILPLEVKARDGNAKSLKFIMMNPDKYHVKNCIKLSSKNIGCSNNIINIPYYLTFMLR